MLREILHPHPLVRYLEWALGLLKQSLNKSMNMVIQVKESVTLRARLVLGISIFDDLQKHSFIDMLFCYMYETLERENISWRKK